MVGFSHELDLFQSVICLEPEWNPNVNQDDILEIKKVPMTSNKDIGVSSIFIIFFQEFLSHPTSATTHLDR